MAWIFRSYRMGYMPNLREYLISFHETTTRALRNIAKEHRDQKSGVSRFGVPESLVDSAVRTFSAAAKEIEDEVLPALR